MNIFRVDIPIFNRSVVVCADCDELQAKQLFYDYEGKRNEIDVPEGKDGCVRHSKGDVFMWVRDSSRASIVFHELTHVAFSICELCGMSFDEELIAYLMGWLKIEVADELFNRSNVQIINGVQ